jgi:hypothetical protein
MKTLLLALVAVFSLASFAQGTEESDMENYYLEISNISNDYKEDEGLFVTGRENVEVKFKVEMCYGRTFKGHVFGMAAVYEFCEDVVMDDQVVHMKAGGSSNKTVGIELNIKEVEAIRKVVAKKMVDSEEALGLLDLKDLDNYIFRVKAYEVDGGMSKEKGGVSLDIEHSDTENGANSVIYGTIEADIMMIFALG